MTKQRYFISILCLQFVPVLLITICFPAEFTNALSDMTVMPASIVVLLGIAYSLFISSFVLAIGMYFAEKIGAQFVLLQEHYDVKKDILKPALVVGVATSCILCVIHMISPFDLFVFEKEVSHFFYKQIIILSRIIPGDVSQLLFWMSGLALLIKTITRSAAMNVIMYASIVLIALLFDTGTLIWNFGITGITLDAAMACAVSIVIGVLFWRKGFEAAVLCHMIIAAIFYMVAPLLLVLR